MKDNLKDLVIKYGDIYYISYNDMCNLDKWVVTFGHSMFGLSGQKSADWGLIRMSIWN